MRIKSLICGVLLLTGCTAKTTLSYTPIIEKQPSKNILVSLEDISDQRINQETIGCARNLYFVPIIKLHSIQNPCSWVSYALEQELINAGYDIENFSNNSRYKIKGDLNKLFVDYYLWARVNLILNLSIFDHEEEVFSKSYEIKRSAAPFKLHFERHLQMICKEFVGDVNAYFSNVDKVGGSTE